MIKFQHIGVLGGGAWGTALAQRCKSAGRDVTLWAREEQVVQDILTHHENKMFLPGIGLETDLYATTDLAELSKVDCLLLVTPAQHLGSMAQDLAGIVKETTPLVICSKGIDGQSHRLLSDVVAQACPLHPIAVLSGPSFADEVAKALPTAVTLGCVDQQIGEGLATSIGDTLFRVYWTDDIVSVQIGGAVKNVIAIAAGVVGGRQMGNNAVAGLITRSLNEIARLSVAMGGKEETLMGLSGMGDLILTCSNMQSRNMSLGFELGQGRSLEEILAGRDCVTEGVHSAAAVAKLAKDLQVDMPICLAVDAIVNQGADIDQTIARLLSRPLKPEAV